MSDAEFRNKKGRLRIEARCYEVFSRGNAMVFTNIGFAINGVL